MANEANLLARDASLLLLLALRVHDQLDHRWDVVLGDCGSIVVEVAFCVRIIIDRIVFCVRDGVSCSPHTAEPNVIPSFKECRGQERLGNVAAAIIKPGVRIF